MALDWRVGLIGLSLGVLSACSGTEEPSNAAPTPDISATTEIQAPADITAETEATVTAVEDAAPALPAEAPVAEAVAEAAADPVEVAEAAEQAASPEPVVNAGPSAAELAATAQAKAAQEKAEAAARATAEAEQAEAARIAAEAQAQAEAARLKAQSEALEQTRIAEAAAAAKEAEAAAAAQAQAAQEAAAAKAREAEAAAAAAAAAVPADGLLASGTWTKKKRTSKGTWSITREGGELFVKLDDDFSTRNAPDLKIFLSPLSAAETSNANAINGALLVSLLSSNKGAQSYKIPSGTDLADYKSILIHCENFTILWSAADL